MELAPVSNPGLGLSVQNEMSRMKHLDRGQQVGEVARQFEAILLRRFLEDSLKPLTQGALGSSDTAGGIYRYHMIDALAQGLVEGGGLGFSSALQSQLQSAASTRTPAEGGDE